MKKSAIFSLPLKAAYFFYLEPFSEKVEILLLFEYRPGLHLCAHVPVLPG